MKKRLLLINPVCGILSTGRICASIAREYEAQGWELRIGYGRRGEVPDDVRKYAVRIGNMVGVYLHAFISLIFGYHATGWCSKCATLKFVKWAEKWNPDIVWLHNLHDNYINVEVLFRWLKNHPEYEVRWTHHDFWAMTGCCTYLMGCEGWQVGCKQCPPFNRGYRRGLFGGSEAREYRRKMRAFTGIKNMQMISPSKWVASYLRRGFLSEYPVVVQHNKIDSHIFIRRASDFKLRYGIQAKKMILGVSAFWETPSKGFSDFMKLARLIDKGTVIVLVGLTKKLLNRIPANVIGLMRTNNAIELAEIYSAADVFFNPTQIDNYPTVNLEAAGCGCPIITYDSGGCPETVEGYDRAEVLSGVEKSPEGFLRAAKRRGFL